MIDAVFNAHNWAGVPFHFWSLVFFILGCIVGSFLNVCIHRLPLGQNLIWPPSHCPHCNYSIPWHLNIPLVTWLWLGGRCRNCAASITPRYFLVELLSGLIFLANWLALGRQSAVLALIYCLFLSGLMVASFIDFEHFIIPDEITIGGMVAGLLCSLFVPRLQGQASWTDGAAQSLLGAGVGAGVIYSILRIGKLLFGRQRIPLTGNSKIIFTETTLCLPEREIPYEELFYRRSDTIVLHAETVELADRCYRNVLIRLTPTELQIGEDVFDPEEIPYMEAIAAEIILPREAMGLGDVKFMAAIGAFLGWQAVLFALMLSSVLGSLVGVTLILLGKRQWSSRMPYGPYLAMAAAIWVFVGRFWWQDLFGGGPPP